jgi:enoyl-CoA hydratase/carnithine racemase
MSGEGPGEGRLVTPGAGGIVETGSRRWAVELLFTGQRLDGDEAARLGMVNRTVADNELDAEVNAFTPGVVEAAPLTVRVQDHAVGPGPSPG